MIDETTDAMNVKSAGGVVVALHTTGDVRACALPLLSNNLMTLKVITASAVVSLFFLRPPAPGAASCGDHLSTTTITGVCRVAVWR